MSTHSLTIAYSGASALIDGYWVRIEQDVADETATVSDAANLLDALYDIDACEGATTEETTSDSTATGEPTTDLATAVEETLDLSFCDADYDGSVEVEIRIYRSHLAEPYTLRLQGGELVSTVQAEGQVTVTAEITSEMTLDYPVVSGFSCTPAPVKRTGNTLRFTEAQVGRSMTATYQSRWDVATVKVLGVDGEVGKCRALAFHHGVVADVDLEVPDADEMDKSLCPSVGWKPLSEREEVTCYRDVVVIQKCQCSEEELHRYTYQQTVPCPDREIKCPGVLNECLHFLGTESVVERVACDSDNQIGGGSLYTYKVSDADYYRKICCQEPPGQLPACPVKRTTYTGNLPIQYGAAYWRDIYGQNARFVPVAPAGGICGEQIIKQQVVSGNCCDGVEPLAWDTSISPEVMSPNSAVTIAVTGGRFPLSWEVDGEGFQFQATGSKEALTTGLSITLSALVGACGTATVTVSDGCSSVTAQIRSTAGAWVEIYLSRGGLLGDTYGVGPYSGPDVGTFSGVGGDGTVGRYEQVAIRGGIKILQWFEGNDGDYARRGWEDGVALCEAWRTAPPRDIRYRSGHAFVWPTLCSTCGECTTDTFGIWFNRAVGFHCTMSPYGNGSYSVRTIWMYVVRTQVWEWQC